MVKKKQEKKSTPEVEPFLVDAPSYERFEDLTTKLLKGDAAPASTNLHCAATRVGTQPDASKAG